MNRKVIARLLGDGIWRCLEPGLYAVPAAEVSWEGLVWAGVLVGGDGARAWGLTAASLIGLTDQQPRPVEILVPNGVIRVDREWVHFRQERDRVRAPSTRADPPRTRIEDTVLDLCATASASACIDWVSKAVQRRLTTPDRLLAASKRRSRVPNRRLLNDLLKDVASGVHSVLEYRYLHDVERAHGLPVGRRQQGRPGVNEFVDVSYDDFSLVVELDGKIGHIEEGRFRDRRRDNRHTKTARPSLRYGYHEVMDEPCGVAREVAEVLVQAGWTGYPARCARCAPIHPSI